MLTLEALDIRQQDFRLQADLSVQTGARVAIVGPSGSGKSTLLGAIAGFSELTSGRILWNGDPIDGLSPGARPVSMLFQDNNLFPHLTAAQNVGLGADPRLRLDRDGWEKVDNALTRVGLEGLGKRRPAALSGGQQSRVALARVLLQDRPLILLDEPFAALGPGLRHDMLALISDLAADVGATVLMVSHDIDDATRFADAIIWLDAGRAEPPRDTADLLANPPDAMRAYLGT